MIKWNIINVAKYVLLSAVALLHTSCYFDSGSDRITGDYKVLWIDSPANQTISRENKDNPSGSSVIVPEYVFAVGHNEDFIIVKQHPTNGFKGGFRVDTAITNYYIIDIKGKFVKNDKGVVGPFAEVEFYTKLRELNISKLSFNKTFANDPN